MLSRLFFPLLLALTTGLLGLPAFAQTWPNKPVRIVTSFGAGSASDIVARLLAQELQNDLGQAFVVENKPGASGIIGADHVAKAAPDGYTFLLTTNTINSGNPHLFKKLPYDPIKDFTPIARVCNFLFVLLVPADQPIKSMDELIAYAKSQPKGISFGYGNSTGQVAGAAFNNLLKLNGVAVPYKSTPQVLTSLVSSEITFAFIDMASSQALTKAGRVRALAISTESPSKLAPQLPTVASTAKLPGFDLAAWVGIIGPAGVPQEIVNRMSTAINQILTRPAVVEKLTALGADVSPGNAAELKTYMARQYEVWRDKIREAGVPAE